MNTGGIPARMRLPVLGLAFAHGLVACHGGELVFAERADEGCLAPRCVLFTSAQGQYFTSGRLVSEVSGRSPDIEVDESATGQIWEGFGGAFNEQGWSHLVAAGLQDEALRLLFGDDGCRFTFGRIPIGASDYAMDRYTLDETPSDLQMEHFSLERDRQLLIPYVRAALAVNPNIRFWACPWTPPTWMKTGQRKGPVPSAFDGGWMKDDRAILDAYARYLTKFVVEYEKEGIPIEIVSPQNEPSYEQNYPSCRWTAEQYSQFIGTYLGPALASAGVPAKVMLGTLSNDLEDPEFATRVRDNAAARPYVGVVGAQWYMLHFIASIEGSDHPPLWQTEHQGGNYPWDPAGVPAHRAMPPNDHAYAVESWGLIRDWIRAGVSAYHAWNMVLDQKGQCLNTAEIWRQNALLVVEDGALTKTPTYWVFRHLSQFVVPGAQVLGATGEDALAFKNPDGSIVTVLFNAGNAKRLVVSMHERMLEFEAPSNGWATLRYMP